MSELSQLKAQLAHCDNTIGNLRHDLKYMTVDRDKLQVRIEAAEGLADELEDILAGWGTIKGRQMGLTRVSIALATYRKAGE